MNADRPLTRHLRKTVPGLGLVALAATVGLAAGCGEAEVTSTVSTVSTVTVTTTKELPHQPSGKPSADRTKNAASDTLIGPKTSCDGEGAGSANHVLVYYIRGQITCRQARLAFAGRAAGSNRWYGWDSTFAEAGEGICYTILRRHANSPRLDGQGAGPAEVKVSTLESPCPAGQE